MIISPAYQNSTSSEASVLLGLPFKATLAIVTAVNGNGSLTVSLQDGPGEELVVWPLPYLVIQVSAQVWVGWFSGVPVVIGGLTGVEIHAAAAHALASDHAVTAEDAGQLAGQGVAYYLNRSNHTGAQPASTISDFDETTRDVVGATLVESATIAFTANDGANQITAEVKPDSITGSLIDSNTIANTHLVDMAAATVKGRAASAGAGPPADLTPAQLNALVGLANLLMSSGLHIETEVLRAASAAGLRLENAAGALGAALANDGSLTLLSSAGQSVTVLNSNLVLDPALPGLRGAGGLAIRIDADNNQSDRIFVIQKDSGTELLRVQENGLVGIGTATPGSQLHIEGASAGVRIQRTGGAAALQCGTAGLLSEGFALYAVAGAGGLRIMTFNAGTEWLRVDGNGRVGIGQSLPNQLLEVAATLAGAAGAHSGAPVLRLTQKADTTYNIGDIHSGIEFYSEDVGGSLPGITGYIRAITTRGNGVIYADAGLVFGTSNGSGGTAVDRLAIDTNGFVSIGTLVPIGKLTVDAETNCYIFVGAHGTAVEAGLALYTTRGTAAAPTATQAGDVLGSLYFQGWDTARSTGARIYAVAAAEWGTAGSASDSPADLRFATVPDGSSTLIDRLVLTSAGLVGLGTLTPTLSDGIGLDVNGKLLRLRTNKTPATSAAPGNPGELCADDSYLYRCCTNQWKRIPWSTF